MSEEYNPNYVVAIGASAGGLAAIEDLLSQLPLQINAPIVIAVHGGKNSILTKVLKFKSSLAIKEAEDGDILKKGTVYVAPGAKHVLFKNNTIILSKLVENSGFRPSIDAMFITMAAEYKERAIAVVLSGLLEDGMRGAQVIYDMGGRTIVQDPKEAKESGMPRSIILNDHPEEILPAAQLGTWLKEYVGVITKE